MNWTSIISHERTGTKTITPDPRSEFQRDFDRLIFNSGFRRLQNKTQVFPLPGIAFVHNRLTHSLEVSSMGRSLGKIVGRHIADHYKLEDAIKDFYVNELSNVIAAACLAHDIGNPPFGHSGEKAISKFFIDNSDMKIENERLRSFFDEKYWLDLINFEGNANGLRLLTHSFNGKTPGGLKLTYSTLAATIKYPCESISIDKTKKIKHKSKFNFFQSEKHIFKEICTKTDMLKENDEPLSYKRHPFVYLTEAADDICFRIIDLEDAQRLGIISSYEVEVLFKNLIKCLKVHDFDKAERSADGIKDVNDRISYLRAKCINALTIICADRFTENANEIINGSFNDELFSIIDTKCSEMKAIKEITEQKIYNNPKVIKVELVGYKVLYELLALFIPAILKKKPSHKDEKLIKLIPQQFRVEGFGSDYDKVLSVLDLISGMSDQYATQLYKELCGIDINTHN